MANITKEAALKYHEEGRPGKIEVRPTKSYRTQADLSLAYSPGVAFPCTEIQNNPADAYKYTDKGNLVAVISNGTAVLGLGDIGALSGKPVMEGKGLLFKIYGGIDVFDIEVDEKDPEKFCEAVERIAPTFGGINLEDIKAPECFYIEERLKKTLNIPVMHDDQHGTAIISGAGLLNALEIVGKKIGEAKIVVNGAGAAAISCTKLYVALGANKENIVMFDSKGVISTARADLNESKAQFATKHTDVQTLADAVKGADVFLGLSKGNVLSQDMVRSMAKDPIVFALANPTPEISFEDAKASRPDVIIATGRSDYPNQINNVLCFPYLFRGALDCHASCINEEMKLAASHAIADLAKTPAPDVVNQVYKVNRLTFGREYILPKLVDPRLIVEVSCAVAKAAMDSGVAAKPIKDWEEYKKSLLHLSGQETPLTRKLHEVARTAPQRVVFVEGTNPTILKAACTARDEGLCHPILLGGNSYIESLAQDLELSLDGIEIVNMRSPEEIERRTRYAKLAAEKFCRRGVTLAEAQDRITESNLFGMMMVEAGDADAAITGLYSRHNTTVRHARNIIGLQPGFKTFCTMHILNSKKGVFMIGDTLINHNPTAEELVEIALLCKQRSEFFNVEPKIAMISSSNFGSDDSYECSQVHKAVEILHRDHPDMIVDGEMQIGFAIDKESRDAKWPFSKLCGQTVNAMIFPNLTSARSSYKILQSLGTDVEVIGPIQTGLNKPIHFVDFDSSVKEIVNVVAIASLEAYVKKEFGNK